MPVWLNGWVFVLRTKWLWVWVLLQSLKLQILHLFQARSSLAFRQLYSVDSLWNLYVTWQEHIDIIITFSVVSNPYTCYPYNSWKLFFKDHDYVLLGSCLKIPCWKWYSQKNSGYVTDYYIRSMHTCTGESTVISVECNITDESRTIVDVRKITGPKMVPWEELPSVRSLFLGKLPIQNWMKLWTSQK